MAQRLHSGIGHAETEMFVKGHVPENEGLQIAGQAFVISPPQDWGHQRAAYTAALPFRGNSEQPQVPVRPGHALPMDAFEIAARRGETVVGALVETQFHLVCPGGPFLVCRGPVGQGVGIARYVRYPSDPQAAEIAVTVVDDWQGRGLGTELIRQLSRRAWGEGIRRFTAMAAADNLAAIRLLGILGAQAIRRGAGAVEYEVILEPC